MPKATDAITSISEKDKQRFLQKVIKRGDDECWKYTGGINRGGYGNFKMRGVTVTAHRVAYRIHFDSHPGELFVCHKCDNPKCCNPGHLFLGTAQDNGHDCTRKRRRVSGASHWTKTHPEKIPMGDAHHARLHPERMSRGERHGSKTQPWRFVGRKTPPGKPRSEKQIDTPPAPV
jgi:hypothetical protein